MFRNVAPSLLEMGELKTGYNNTVSDDFRVLKLNHWIEPKSLV